MNIDASGGIDRHCHLSRETVVIDNITSPKRTRGMTITHAVGLIGTSLIVSAVFLHATKVYSISCY